MELALFGSLLLEDTSVFNLHRTGDETDFTAFLHQASYPPVVVKFLCRIIKDTYIEHPRSTSDHFLISLRVIILVITQNQNSPL